MLGSKLMVLFCLSSSVSSIFAADDAGRDEYQSQSNVVFLDLDVYNYTYDSLAGTCIFLLKERLLEDNGHIFGESLAILKRMIECDDADFINAPADSIARKNYDLLSSYITPLLNVRWRVGR